MYTNQRLSLSTTWEGPRLTCRGFKPDSGNLTVRHFRGASRTVRHGETVNPPAIERAGPETPHLQRGALDLYPNTVSEGYRWKKGGRLYSQPQGPSCYQSQPEAERPKMRINGESVVEIDISSSYLTIFYALCDEQLDTTQDAYADILGRTPLDRHVAKFWINASFGNSKLLSGWSRKVVQSLEEQLTKKGLSGFDKKRYPMKKIREDMVSPSPTSSFVYLEFFT